MLVADPAVVITAAALYTVSLFVKYIELTCVRESRDSRVRMHCKIDKSMSHLESFSKMLCSFFANVIAHEVEK